MQQGHRWFAAFWDRATRLEGKKDRRARELVASGARGRVLELGVGVGTNWAYLPQAISYSGIDPDPYMLERARRNAAAAGRDPELVQAPAEALPYPDAAFDTVIVTLTLCTVSDVPRALAEARRVLRAGGELRFWEHVRPAGSARGRLFDAITPVWRRVGAGCHPNRDTVAAIERAGFHVRTVRRYRAGIIPMVLGVAVASGADA